MMEQLKHECGVAMIRLLKPLDYFEKKYGTWAYGFNKLYLMMEKQHNRGQEGAGLATVCLNKEPGTEYMFREKAEGKDAITEIFSRVTEEMAGELYMGHLRYSTTGKSGLTFVHPFLRRNNWRAKNLCLCGNFNMTNIDEVFQFLTAQGQSPRIYGDSYITLELMGHRLDREVERLYQEAREKGLEGIDITNYIDDHVEMANVLKTTMIHYDGGYVMCGLTGSGEMFAVRDPWGREYLNRQENIIFLPNCQPGGTWLLRLPMSSICIVIYLQPWLFYQIGYKVLENLVTARGVFYFAVELKRETLFIKILCCRKRTVFGASHSFKAFSKLQNSILVAHPHLLVTVYSLKKRAFCRCAVHSLIKLKGCKTKFANRSLANLAVITGLYDIVTVAKSKNRNIKT